MTKINTIINELKTLNLLEITALIEEIKKVFNINISDSNLMNVLPTSNIPSVKENENSIKEEKTSFSIILNEVPSANKIAILKVVRNITGLGLKESKEIIDNVPKMIKEDLNKEECDRLKKELENVGAKLSIK